MLRRPSTAALLSPLCAALCLVLFLAAPGAAAAQHHKKRDYKREIEQMEEQWRTAQLAGDVGAMDHLLADDYVGISINGEVNTKTQQLDRLRTRSLIVNKITVSDMKVKLVGPVAIVTSLAEVEGTNNGTPLKGQYRYTRVYQRVSPNIWKITNFELTHVPQRRGAHLQPDPDDAPIASPPPQPQNPDR
jgi:ketosteroid isomerase-like protein